MLELGKLRVRRWAQWEDGELDLGFRGTTFFRGINYDKGGNPNGAGKSTIFYGLEPVLLGDHVLSVRKNALKSVSSEATQISLRGMREKRDFKLVLKGTSLDVSIDGKKRDVREKGAARSLVEREILRMSPELWSSMVHCVGIAGNPLIRGTSAQRCQFIEKAFDLDRWAGKYKKVGDILSAMRRAASDLEDAKKELADLKAPESVDDVRAELSELKERRDKLKKRLSVARAELSKFGGLPDKPERSSAFYEDKVRQIEASLAQQSKLSAAYTRWSVAKKQQSAVDDERKNLTERVKKLSKQVPSTLSVEDLQEKKADLRSRVDELVAYQDVAATIKTWRKLASRIAERHGIRYVGLEELRSLSRSWCSALAKGGSRCPVCGSKFRKEINASDIKELSRYVDDLPDSLASPKHDGDVDELQSRLRKIARQLEVSQKLAELRRRLKSLRDVDVPDAVDYDPDASSNLGRKLAAAKELARRAALWEKAPQDFDVEACRSEVAKLEERLESTADRVAKLSESVARIEEQREAHKRAKNRVQSLSEEVALHPVYRGLQSAYSSNGMRLWLLSEMLEAIVTSLNSTVESTRERISYGYKLSRNRDLSLTASNLSGTFDVRMLSGGEAGVFVINLAMAILPMLPDSKRVSTLILDEVDANASTQTRRIISNEFLPKLQKIVPSLWIVTPTSQQEFRMSGAREMLVEKRNAVSRLVGDV